MNRKSSFGTQESWYMLCRSLRKKLEEELGELNSKIDELTSETGETTIQKLEKEIRICKNMIKCTVCTDRPKEVTTSQLIQLHTLSCFHIVVI